MVREGGFSLAIRVGRRDVRETRVDGHGMVALATAGSAFEVVLRNDNRSTYCVRLFVDGEEAEPGYVKKLRGQDETAFKGWLCGRDLHEFLFARTPVDDNQQSAAGSGCGDSAATTSRRAHIGEVKAFIYATRRVRAESSSDDSGDDSARRSSASLGLQALPEKEAVKVSTHLNAHLINCCSMYVCMLRVQSSSFFPSMQSRCLHLRSHWTCHVTAAGARRAIARRRSSRARATLPPPPPRRLSSRKGEAGGGDAHFALQRLLLVF